MVTGAKDFIASLPDIVKKETLAVMKQIVHIDKLDSTFNEKAKTNLNRLEESFGKLLDIIEEFSDTIPDSSSSHTDFAILIRNLENRINHQYEKFGLLSNQDCEANNIVAFPNSSSLTQRRTQAKLAVA